MQFSTAVVASLLSISSMAAARITGITLPKQVATGSNFTAIVNTLPSIDIQSTADVSIAFGAAPAEYAIAKTLGTHLLAQKALGPELSNIQTNISVPLTVPADFQKGEAVITAALFSLSGSRYSGILDYFNVTITVADVTDASEFVSTSDAITVY
ncbi:hypothetical protein GTA08_BOTSDO06201 [Botryosphaeria dothidea]|uniref:Secreted protein nis1 protein n=1 Tax=Botryosphaeria dothidea TaxID=55169 RepID=A0A8H4IRH7_9PEZI|nr:hypothetical protein GTA08_BOTSDO10298 [Botryosphaeria dothidea]KAF4305699.1 hypothetical protein GTA08_BOTSDO06201 [Botryosphaeria dothidea]